MDRVHAQGVGLMGKGSIRGDFPALRDGISNIRRIGDAGPELWRRIAPTIKSNIEAQFSAGVNPYDTPWKPLRPATLAKGRTPPPLTATGGLRRSIAVTVQGYILRVVARDLVAGLHQNGWTRTRNKYRRGRLVGKTTIGPGATKRQILPDGRIPNKWRQQIRKMAREIMGERLGRKIGVRELT